jgi:Cu-Zn family superoxide dismutase
MKTAFACAAVVLAGAFLTAGNAARADEVGIGNVALETAEGQPAGTATLAMTPHGLLVAGDFRNLPVGEHGFHIHETGSCAPDFGAAGDHFNPTDRAHGYANPAGLHAGDMPNLFVASDGTAKVHVFNQEVRSGMTEDALFDADGAALIIHADPDTYLSEARAGGRIACGVIVPAGG